MKNLFLFIIVLSASIAKADYVKDPKAAGFPVEEIQRYLESGHTPSGGDPFLGLPYRWPVYFDEKAASYGGGVATMVNGQKLVILAPSVMNQVGNLIAGTILQHEYCHHETEYHEVSAVREGYADCCAAQHLKAAGRTDAIWAAANNHGTYCSYDPDIDPVLTPTSHPCGYVRRFITLKCGGEL